MECIFKARDQIDCIWREIEKCNIDNPSEKINFISTMLYVAFNHCDGIQTLAQKRNFASAFALVRPLLESSFRAIWLHRCATESQIKKCLETDKWKSALGLAKEIESEMEFTPILSEVWSELRPSLHSYTHGGVHIAVKHINDENIISPNIEDQEVLQLMQIVGLISLYILAEFIDLSKNIEQFQIYEKVGNDFVNWAFNK
ncbi:MAG: hypothetical protein GYB20_07740 [Oceanospirillales bacterium]|nr:hypothetical protein [Oceanospirillales bacterium]MBR9887573.1 hypothetical protein [Oceanospirillales bacterium]